MTSSKASLFLSCKVGYFKKKNGINKKTYFFIGEGAGSFKCIICREHNLEYRIIHPEGYIHWVMVIGDAERKAEGEAIQWTLLSAKRCNRSFR